MPGGLIFTAHGGQAAVERVAADAKLARGGGDIAAGLGYGAGNRGIGLRAQAGGNGGWLCGGLGGKAALRLGAEMGEHDLFFPVLEHEAGGAQPAGELAQIAGPAELREGGGKLWREPGHGGAALAFLHDDTFRDCGHIATLAQRR